VKKSTRRWIDGASDSQHVGEIARRGESVVDVMTRDRLPLILRGGMLDLVNVDDLSGRRAD
jgi:hypothetical protein